MTLKSPLLQLTDLKKYYPIKSKYLKKVKANVKAVNGVTLDVYAGDTIGIVGESGCGKSTLGRTIMQLEDITDGKVIFNGNNLGDKSNKSGEFRKDIQMVFQDPFASLNPRQKIGDAIEEPLIIHTSLSKKERAERVSKLLKEVGLTPEHASRLPHELSGGQRQRVGIGRAIALNPKLVICDEPVSALDVSVQAQILKLLQNIQENEDLTYLFISHDLGVVRYICNRVLVMYLGHMVELAPVEKLYNNPTHPYTEVLLSAIPRPDVDTKRDRIKVVGEIPSPTDLPKGCPFSTRCPIATERCAVDLPEWKEIDEDHYIRCHER